MYLCASESAMKMCMFVHPPGCSPLRGVLHMMQCLFWTIMGKNKGGEPTGALADKMKAAFGSYDDFKSQFSAAAAGVFGSGWAWLAVAKDGSVKIVTTPNQDNPLMDGATEAGLIPIMGIDVWEHAYYLKYQNR